jgi:four helix bundle protein
VTKKENIILTKTFNFAKNITKLYVELKKDKIFELASQLFKSGTSIGANVEEAQAAQSKRDFIAKMSIAAKEARETKYWLRLLKETEISAVEVDNLLNDIEDIINILSKIVKTSGAT